MELCDLINPVVGPALAFLIAILGTALFEWIEREPATRNLDMSEKKDTGGPAFPRPASTDAHDDPCNVFSEQSGMSLRDWFAGQALMGISEYCASIRFEEEGEGGAERVVNGAASIAYAFADAMLSHRNKETSND